MVELEAKGQASAQSTTGTVTLGPTRRKKKENMNDANDSSKSGKFGQFGQFKVNLGSGINFVFVTLNFSDQNFLRAQLTQKIFWMHF